MWTSLGGTDAGACRDPWHALLRSLLTDGLPVCGRACGCWPKRWGAQRTPAVSWAQPVVGCCSLWHEFSPALGDPGRESQSRASPGLPPKVFHILAVASHPGLRVAPLLLRMGKVLLGCSGMNWNMLWVAPAALAPSFPPKTSSVCHKPRPGFESWLPRCLLGDLGAGNKFFFFFLERKNEDA